MIFFVMAQWLRLGVLARRRSHRKMFRVVTFMPPPAFYITIQTCLHLYRQKLLKFEWFDVMWQETPRVEIRPGRKSWDRAEMAQTGQNYHYFPKRAENQNDQNLMVVWWYRMVSKSWFKFWKKNTLRVEAMHSRHSQHIPFRSTCAQPCRVMANPSSHWGLSASVACGYLQHW